MKIVITGSSCSGKTTVIKTLEREGFKVLHEIPRQLIKKYKKEGINPTTNIHKFQYEILKLTLERNKNIRDDEITFLDIDIPEGVAYFKARNMQPPEWLTSAIEKHAIYDKVIFLEQAPFFENDNVRLEDHKTSKKIGEIIEKTYEKLNYKVHKIPFIKLDERIKIIKRICGLI